VERKKETQEGAGVRTCRVQRIRNRAPSTWAENKQTERVEAGQSTR